MNNPNSNITVEIHNSTSEIDIEFDALEKLIEHTCHRFGVSQGMVNVEIVSDEHIRKINEQFLGHTETTDVISFDLTDESDSAKTFDLVVNSQMAVRQANVRGHKPEAELALYIVHGLLHNLGFDDSSPVDSQKMHKAEDEILQDFGYGVIYNSDDE